MSLQYRLRDGRQRIVPQDQIFLFKNMLLRLTRPYLAAQGRALAQGCSNLDLHHGPWHAKHVVGVELRIEWQAEVAIKASQVRGSNIHLGTGLAVNGD